MNSRFTVVETSLNRAEFRWKALRLWQQSLLLGMALCLACLLFGLLMLAGAIPSPAAAVSGFVVLGVLGIGTWAVLLMNLLAGTPDRHWLADAVERVDRRFLDRLHALLFLEQRPGDPVAESFAQRIAQQTQGVLAQGQPPAAFRARSQWISLGLFLALLTATVAFYHSFSPYQRLALAHKTKAAPAPRPDKPMELALPTNNIEQHRPWGEVRITDPGADLKVTKVDVVPLQIEAAANQPLKTVNWFSAVNGAAETAHPLPAPTDPRYAVYQPTIYLDELRLQDWDVLTYYAKANTDPQHAYASEVYFVEVRPFREDILKMPGGEGGKPYQSLNEISSLINRQQHIIRQTYQHLQRPQAQEGLQAQDRKKLSEAEGDLGSSVQHLYAKLATEMENKPIGVALDNLAKAQNSLTNASRLLGDNIMAEAQNRERSALAELIAARKMFQKAVSDNPGAFQEEPQPGDQDASPVADNSKKLNEMAEFRNESKAAQEFVKKTVEQQKTLEQQAGSQPREQLPNLANQEQQLQKSLEDFQSQHPQVFKGTQTEAQDAKQAMNQAVQALEQKSEQARAATQKATQQLEKLGQTLQGQAVGQQLADAYKMKQMLDKQIRSLDQATKSNAPAGDNRLAQTANEAKETVEQLKKTADQAPTRDAFGQPLRDALSGKNKADLDNKLSELASGTPADSNRQQQASDARQALAQVSKAFEQSQPQALQNARQQDSLKPGAQDSFGQGMAELDSLLKQLQQGHSLSPQDQAKQGQQALADLQTGMRSQFGDNPQGNQLLQQLQQQLQGNASPDIGDLKKLMDQLQHFSVEASEKLDQKKDQPELTNIDPSRLPPAYRGRIQKYFQKLSEQ